MSQSHRQPLVFVVDDEDVIASTLAMILRSQGGFEAGAFTMPLDALEAAQLYAPDLLISDVVGPALSGIDLGNSGSGALPGLQGAAVLRPGRQRWSS